MSFLESFENVNQERGYEIVDPINVSVERVLYMVNTTYNGQIQQSFRRFTEY